MGEDIEALPSRAEDQSNATQCSVVLEPVGTSDCGTSKAVEHLEEGKVDDDKEVKCCSASIGQGQTSPDSATQQRKPGAVRISGRPISANDDDDGIVGMITASTTNTTPQQDAHHQADNIDEHSVFVIPNASLVQEEGDDTTGGNNNNSSAFTSNATAAETELRSGNGDNATASSVELVKATPVDEEENKVPKHSILIRRRYVYCCVCLGLVVIASLVVGLSVSLTRRSRKRRNKAKHNQPRPRRPSSPPLDFPLHDYHWTPRLADKFSSRNGDDNSHDSFRRGNNSTTSKTRKNNGSNGSDGDNQNSTSSQGSRDNGDGSRQL